MKKILLACALVLLAVAGAGAYYIVEHRDPLKEAKALLSKGDIKAASLQLRSAVRDEPNNAEAHALLAQVDIVTDDAVAAEYEIKRAMALGWDKAASLAMLSQAYMRQSKWKEILADIPEKGATVDQSAYFLMTHAVAERNLKQIDKANTLIAEALQLAPASAEVHLAAARFALADSKPDAAMAEVDRAITLDAKDVDALQFKALLLTLKNDTDTAIADLTSATAIAPTRYDLLVQRAELYVRKNEDAKADADIAAALKINPRDVQATYVHMVLLARAQKFADADLELQKLDQVIDRFQRGLFFKALVKSRVNQLAQAEEAITAYVSRFPGDADGVRLLARIEMDAQHPDRALPYVKRAVDAGQRDTATLNLLGQLYGLTGQQGEAERTFQLASQGATTPNQLTQLASARLQIGDLAGAAGDLQRSLTAAPQGQTQPGAAEALIAASIRLGQLDKAQEELDKLRQQTGETEAVGNLSGLIKIARLDVEGALKDFADTAQRFPDAVGARLNQAKALVQLNRVQEAIPVLQAILDKDPAQTETLALLAQILLSQNRGDEAIAAAERARKAKPNDFGLINGEAQVYARMQQYAKAIEVIETARQSGKLPTPLLGTLGSVQLAAGQNDAAKQTFAELLAAEPNNLGVILTDIDVLARVKDWSTARNVLDAALQRMPGNLPLLQARVRVDLLDQGLDAALQTADKLAASPAQMPAAATLKGGLLMGAHRFTDAVAEFQAQFNKEPSAALAVALAEAKQSVGDTAGGIATLQSWLAAHQTDALAAQALGAMQMTVHDYDGAARNFELVLQQQANNAVALNNLAWIYQQRGDKRARELAQRAFQTSPTPEITDTLAWILTNEGEAARALPLLQRAAAEAAANPTIQYHLAYALNELKRPDDAIKVLKPVVDSQAQFDDRQAAEALMQKLTKGG